MLAFESPLLLHVGLARYVPDIALVFVLYSALTSRFTSGLALAFTLGLIKDGFALTTPVGMHTEIMVVVFLICFRISRRLALRGPLGVMILTALFSVGASLLELVLSLLFDSTFPVNNGGISQILTSMIPQAFLTAPFGPFVFWLIERLDRIVTRQSDTHYL